MEGGKLTRKFAYNGVNLADPDPSMSVDQVRDVYVATYPELAVAQVEGPTFKGNQAIYSFRRAVGEKG